MNTALVLGSNAGQADLIRHLKQAGWTVATCAHRAGGSGEKIADRFDLVDIRDADGVADLARRVGADLVYSVSSDVAVPSVVKASDTLGLPRFFDMKLVQLFNDKAALRAHLDAHDLSPVPFIDVRTWEDAAGWDRFPCIVKPSDSQGQRGVQKVLRAEDLQAAVETAIALSPTNSCIVEDYLEGVEISSNVLVSDDEVVVSVISERLVHEGPHVGIPIGHLIPTVNVEQRHLDEAQKLIRDVVASLFISDGPLYFQMKVTPDGPRIIEIAPRLDGCHIWRLMTISRDLNYLDLTVRRLLGEKIAATEGDADREGVYELMFQQTPPDTVFSAADFPVPPDALYHEYRYEDGDKVGAINGRLEVVGYYVRKR